MTEDPIVREVRRLRESYSAEFDFDVEALAADLKEKEAKSRRKLVTLPPRRPTSKDSSAA